MTFFATYRNRFGDLFLRSLSMSTLPLVAALLVLAPHTFAAGSPDDSPHWKKDACQTCHQNAAPDPGNITLRSEPERQCAGCHGSRGGALPCRHASDIPAGEFAMSESYRESLKDGQVVCTTCHDLTVQCLSPNKQQRFVNPSFIRDRSSPDTSEQCYQCHEKSGYERLNPHRRDAGDSAEATCLLCHAHMPEADDTGWIAVDFNMQGSLNEICLGCHNVRPHPGDSLSGRPVGWEHLAIPSAEVLKNMKLTEAETGAIFPLDPYNGEVHCATCHNPHDDQLQGYPVAVPQGSVGRFRVDNICQACHDK